MRGLTIRDQAIFGQAQAMLLENAIMATAPYGYWKLDETTGTVANDSSGNNRHGTYGGTYTLANDVGPLGKAYCRLSNGHVDLGNLASPGDSAGLAFFWVGKRTTGSFWLGKGGVNTYSYAVDANGGVQATTYRSEGFAISTVRLVPSPSGSNFATMPSNGTWGAYGVVFPGSEHETPTQLRFNRPDNMAAAPTSTLVDSSTTNSQPLYIGKRGDGGNIDAGMGHVVCWRMNSGGLPTQQQWNNIFNAALIEGWCTTIQPIPSLEQAILNQQPVGYWKLNETTGTVATDSSGNARHGTYSGAYTLNFHSGINSTHVDLNGGKISIPGAAVFNATNADGLTIMALVKKTIDTSQPVITKGDYVAGSKSYEWGMYAGGRINHTYWGELGSSVSTHLTNTSHVTTNEWQLVAAQGPIPSANVKLNIYEATRERLPTTASSSGGTHVARNPGADVNIGGRADGSGALLGGVAHVAVFSGVKNLSEIYRAAQNEGWISDSTSNPPITLYTDDFNRPDSATLGSSWIERANFGMRIFSNRLSGGSATGVSRAFWNVDLSNNHFMEFDCLGDANASFYFRCNSNDPSTGYELYWESGAGGTFFLRRGTVQSSLTAVTSQTSTGTLVGQRLRIQIVGSLIKAFINGVEKFSYTDTTYLSGGYVGIRIDSTTNDVDNFSCGPL